VIIGIAILLSGGVFYFYTKKKLDAHRQPQPPTAISTAAAIGSPATGTSTAAAGAKSLLTAPSETALTPATPRPSTVASVIPSPGFARPLDLGKALSQSLSSGDMAGAARLAPTTDATRSAAAADVLENIFKNLGYKVGPEGKVMLLGQVGEATRLSIPLMKPGESKLSLSLQVDVERDPKMGWKITQFHLPKELLAALANAPAGLAMANALAAAPVPGAAEPPASKGNAPAITGAATTSAMVTVSKIGNPLFVVDDLPDSLSYASDFVQALLRLDFATASKFIDPSKVSPQKLAGLCIVFEEGQYELKPNKPMVITVASPQVSWVIAQVQSEKLQQNTEFGVEMQRASEGKPWQIVGLNLSDLLSSFAKSADKMGVPYTPIVTNPKGGESLALYFEYDQAGLHPRARKQLEIVAGLLKSNVARKLHITGHTDALGTDGYNMGLSKGRAQAVKEQLVALGVAPDQVITEGVGKTSPLGPNQKSDGSDNPEGRSQNRRAEIFLDF
jgi:outer membrane protein OmpA-like peptidoglycan-associated protein